MSGTHHLAGLGDLSEELLPIAPCWERVLETITKLLRVLVRLRPLESRDLANLAQLIHGLERLPHVTNGCLIEASLSRRALGDTTSLSIALYESSLTILRCGVVGTAPLVDTWSKMVLQVEPKDYVCGDGETDEELCTALERWAFDWLDAMMDSKYTFDSTDDSGRNAEAFPDCSSVGEKSCDSDLLMEEICK